MCEAVLASPVREDKGGPVCNVHLRSRVTGCERSVARDHDQLVAGVPQRTHAGLALRLQRALQHDLLSGWRKRHRS